MRCWAELAQELIGDGADVLITGGRSDRNRAEALSGMIGCPGHVRVLAGDADLLHTMSYLAAAAVVVSVNTSVMHLAAALDQRLVALHGPTNPRRWGPLSTKAVIIGPGPNEGGAYLNLGFEYPPNPPDCMSTIPVREVLDRARQLMISHREETVLHASDVSLVQ
jgi:ADP-heptose:LPS heptosyltransferase